MLCCVALPVSKAWSLIRSLAFASTVDCQKQRNSECFSELAAGCCPGFGTTAGCKLSRSVILSSSSLAASGCSFVSLSLTSKPLMSLMSLIASARAWLVQVACCLYPRVPANSVFCCLSQIFIQRVTIERRVEHDAKQLQSGKTNMVWLSRCQRPSRCASTLRFSLVPRLPSAASLLR